MHLIPLPINAEPWAIGTASVGRRGGGTYARIAPNAQLVAYQEAVREAVSDWMTTNGVTPEQIMSQGYDRITFYVWRVQGEYIRSDGRTQHRNRVDVTNIQKGTEDALQGLLFKNDVTNRDVRTVMVEQVKQADVPQDYQPWVVIALDHVSIPKVLEDIPTSVFSYMADYLDPIKPSLFSPTGSVHIPFADDDNF